MIDPRMCDTCKHKHLQMALCRRWWRQDCGYYSPDVPDDTDNAMPTDAPLPQKPTAEWKTLPDRHGFWVMWNKKHGNLDVIEVVLDSDDGLRIKTLDGGLLPLYSTYPHIFYTRASLPPFPKQGEPE